MQIPAGRLSELHAMLKSIPTTDLLEMKRKCRFYLENYLANKRGDLKNAIQKTKQTT